MKKLREWQEEEKQKNQTNTCYFTVLSKNAYCLYCNYVGILLERIFHAYWSVSFYLKSLLTRQSCTCTSRKYVDTGVRLGVI